MKASLGDLLSKGYKETSPGVFERVDDFLSPTYESPVPVQKVPVKSFKPTPIGLTTDEARLNQLETDFLNQILRPLEKSGTIKNIGIQAINLKLANDCRYLPDFTAFIDAKMVCYEVKGRQVWEDSIIKLKVAARIFPLFKFYFCTRNEEKVWNVEEVKS